MRSHGVSPLVVQHLSYGTDGLDVVVPDGSSVVQPIALPALVDEAGTIVGALRAPLVGPPLAELVSPGQSVVVVFPDLTRPMPSRTVLPPLLAELERLGAGPAAVTLLCATGSHRQASPAEMETLVGADIVARYRIIDHDAEGDCVEVGSVDGTAVLLDRAYVEADVRIVTGFVEPHFFAGFSGGPKAVCPGVAALSTILEAHHPWRIADPNATWTVTVGNPVHDFVRAAVALLPPTLSVDVTIDRDRRITGVFVGPLPHAHEAATAAVERAAVQKVPEAFDVVVTTNSGAPLDLNLYQCTKGISAAARIVKKGGTIILAAECADGLPAGSGFEKLLEESTSPTELADASRPAQLDRWASQILGRALLQAEIWMFSTGLSVDDMRRAQLRKVDDVGAAVTEALAQHGPGATLCILPEGPQTVVSVVPTAAPPLLSDGTVARYLIDRGLVGARDAVTVSSLGGGVSNVVLAVATPSRRLVVKQALPRLRVAQEWLADPARARTEAAALRLAAALTPKAVPRVLDDDAERCALVLEAAPAGWAEWKVALLAGDVDPTVAARVGVLLAAWHAATTGLAGDATFDQPRAFDQLRLDPYYRAAAAAHPDLAPMIAARIDVLSAARTCLVHGDLSPKNVLVGEDGLWVIDFEVAHVGHPAFDVAFLTSHLFLKAAHGPSHVDDLRSACAAFWSAYETGGGLDAGTGEALDHLGVLLLARVDGKSPVEYLDTVTRDKVRTVARSFVGDPPETLDDAWARAGAVWR